MVSVAELKFGGFQLSVVSASVWRVSFFRPAQEAQKIFKSRKAIDIDALKIKVSAVC
jgi:hypothetical protein